MKLHKITVGRTDYILCTMFFSLSNNIVWNQSSLLAAVNKELERREIHTDVHVLFSSKSRNGWFEFLISLESKLEYADMDEWFSNLLNNPPPEKG